MSASPSTPPPVDRRNLLSIREAAERCHVDYDTFLRWVLKGVIPHVVVGPANLKRVYERDVDGLIRDGPIEK